MDLLVAAVLLLCVAVLAGCGDRIDRKDFIAAFSLDRDYYEVRLARGTTTVAITNGSGDLALEVADETILQATYTGGLSADELKGVINLYGKRKGTTTLTVTDRITGDRQTVEVKVTDCYLACNIFDSNHPSLKAGTTLFWVNNPHATAISSIRRMYSTPPWQRAPTRSMLLSIRKATPLHSRTVFPVCA